MRGNPGTPPEITLRPYKQGDRHTFTAMLDDYFNSDLSEGMDIGRLSFIAARIEYELGVFTERLYMLCAGGRGGGAIAGFVWFQVDTEGNPWCIKPGWGFIREIYVRPEMRRLGLGGLAAKEAVNALRGLGVKNIYLTSESETAERFWVKMGFRDSGEVCEKNGLKIFVRGAI